MTPQPLSSVLLAMALLVCAPLACAKDVVLAASLDRIRSGAGAHGPRSAPTRIDKAVEPATFQLSAELRPLQAKRIKPDVQAAPEAPPATADVEESSNSLEQSDRLLGVAKVSERTTSTSALTENPFRAITEWRPSTQTLTATGGALATAVGLIFSLTWLVRCCAPRSARPLPRDVIEVLGRAPLTGKQTTQLVRVGGKLVLLALSPEGVETLTEITDPDEVARILAACDSASGRGSNAEFDKLLQQMSAEPAKPGFLGDRDESSYGPLTGAFDPRSLAAAYANTPGGRGDG